MIIFLEIFAKYNPYSSDIIFPPPYEYLGLYISGILSISFSLVEFLLDFDRPQSLMLDKIFHSFSLQNSKMLINPFTAISNI